MAVRLLFVDDHGLARWALARMVDAEPDLVIAGEASSAEEALHLAAVAAPDVVTIGVTASGDAGFRLARHLRDRYQLLGIVILTTGGADDILFRAMETGASAFVSKCAAVPEILSAIRHSAVAASSFSAAGLADALRRRQQTRERLALSPREQEVLRLLVAGQSVPAIAATLYVSLSTAKTYVSRLYEKLGAGNRAQAVMAAVRLGMAEHDAAVVG
jgi:DNA-binding NarL/FixJ family response regulator